MPADNLNEAKQQHHANLAAEHKRLADFHESHAGDVSGTPQGANNSVGAQAGGFIGALASHKWWIIGGVVAIIVIFFVVLPAISNNNNNTANQAGNYANTAGGLMPSDISTALDNVNTTLSELMQNQGGSSGTGTGTTTSPTGSAKTFTITQAVKNKWPTGTLHKIAKSLGITYDQLYSANVSVLGPDPNHAQYGIGTVLTIPAKATNLSASNTAGNSVSNLSTIASNNVGSTNLNA